MNFVNHLNLFGVEAKETPCIKGTGAPSKTTEGAVGVLYMDTDTGYIYKCISVVENEFIWEFIQPQANWEQVDETAPDYIKNKTHWTEYNEDKIIFNEEVGMSNGVGLSNPLDFKPGKTYVVTIDGVEYETKAKLGTMLGMNGKISNGIGNKALMNSALFEDTGESFAIANNLDGTSLMIIG